MQKKQNCQTFFFGAVQMLCQLSLIWKTTNKALCSVHSGDLLGHRIALVVQFQSWKMSLFFFMFSTAVPLSIMRLTCSIEFMVFSRPDNSIRFLCAVSGVSLNCRQVFMWEEGKKDHLLETVWTYRRDGANPTPHPA